MRDVEDDYDDFVCAAEAKARNVYVRFLIADLRMHLRAKAYNPDQPRDDHGRWTSEDGNTGDIGGQNHTRRAQVAESGDDWTRSLGTDPNAGEKHKPDYAYGLKYSPDLPGWHDYAAGPNIVCTARQQCTSAQMADYLSRFAVPGQNPNAPVVSGKDYWVFDPTTDFVVPFMNVENQRFGPSIFDTVDGQMRDYIARNNGTQKSAARLIHIARSGLGTYPGLPLRTRPKSGGFCHEFG